MSSYPPHTRNIVQSIRLPVHKYDRNCGLFNFSGDSMKFGMNCSKPTSHSNPMDFHTTISNLIQFCQSVHYLHLIRIIVTNCAYWTPFRHHHRNTYRTISFVTILENDTNAYIIPYEVISDARSIKVESRKTERLLIVE